MQIKCKIWWDVNVAVYRISTPYSPEFVAFLKNQIPASDRAYDSTSKQWTFTEKYLDPVRFIAEKIWASHSEVNVVDKQHAEDASKANLSRTPTGVLNDTLVEFMRLISYDAAKAAYRKAAVELHPDRNPTDDGKMSRLNAAWTRIEKELFTK